MRMGGARALLALIVVSGLGDGRGVHAQPADTVADDDPELIVTGNRKERAQQLYARARANHAAARYRRAIALFERGLAHDADTVVLYYVGDSYSQLGDCPNAIRFYSRFLVEDDAPAGQLRTQAELRLRACGAEPPRHAPRAPIPALVDENRDRDAPIALQILAGVGAGVAGGVVGGIAGDKVCGDDDIDRCWPVVFAGVYLGSFAGVGTGVYVAGGTPGYRASFGATLGGAFLGSAFGLGGAIAFSDGSLYRIAVPMIGGPLLGAIIGFNASRKKVNVPAVAYDHRAQAMVFSVTGRF